MWFKTMELHWGGLLAMKSNSSFLFQNDKANYLSWNSFSIILCRNDGSDSAMQSENTYFHMFTTIKCFVIEIPSNTSIANYYYDYHFSSIEDWGLRDWNPSQFTRLSWNVANQLHFAFVLHLNDIQFRRLEYNGKHITFSF